MRFSFPGRHIPGISQKSQEKQVEKRRHSFSDGTGLQNADGERAAARRQGVESAAAERCARSLSFW